MRDDSSSWNVPHIVSMYFESTKSLSSLTTTYQKNEESKMKSKNTMIALSIFFLLFAVTMSLVFWSDVSSVVKIAFFAFGYGSGITTSKWLAKREQ